MSLFKNVRIGFLGFMAVFLLMGLPSFADIDPDSIMGNVAL